MPSLGREVVNLALSTCREDVPPVVPLDVVRAVIHGGRVWPVGVETSPFNRDGPLGVGGDAARVGEEVLGLERDSIEMIVA